MVTERFSSATNEALLESGWFEGRKEVITDLVEPLLDKHVTVHVPAMEFWQEFRDLSLKYKLDDEECEVWLEPRVYDMLKLRSRLPDAIARLDQFIGPLIRLGEDSWSQSDLWMARDGMVLALFEGFWPVDSRAVVVGKSGGEAIERICSGKAFSPVMLARVEGQPGNERLTVEPEGAL